MIFCRRLTVFFWSYNMIWYDIILFPADRMLTTRWSVPGATALPRRSTPMWTWWSWLTALMEREEQSLLGAEDTFWRWVQIPASDITEVWTGKNMPGFSRGGCLYLYRHTQGKKWPVITSSHLLTYKSGDQLLRCLSSPVLRSGPTGVPGAGSDQLRHEDPPQQELHHALHAILHEERGHAGSRPAQPVWWRAVQGVENVPVRPD